MDTAGLYIKRSGNRGFHMHWHFRLSWNVLFRTYQEDLRLILMEVYI